MFSDSIEQLKNQFTDKYVAVDATRPELARFRDLVGQVKTVNMSGRALVEFMDYHLSTGWYDIDLSCLKVVDKPLPQEKKAEARKPAEKPAAKAAAPAAAAKPAASPAAAGGSGKKMSVAEMMAAARANKPGGAAPAEGKSEAPAAKKEAPAKPAAPAESAEAPASAEAPKKIDRSKMSVAEMLAAARKADKKD